MVAVDLDHLTEVVLVRFLHCNWKVTLPRPSHPLLYFVKGVQLTLMGWKDMLHLF